MDVVNHIREEEEKEDSVVWCRVLAPLFPSFHHCTLLVDALRSFLSSPPISHLPLRAAQPRRRRTLHCGMRGHVIWWMERGKEGEGEPKRGGGTVKGKRGR